MTERTDDARSPMSAKAHRAQETRWRFLSIRTKEGGHHRIEFENRSLARAFAQWLIATRTVRRIDLRDTRDLDSGFGWADPE